MFDEPLGALDRTLREDLLNELRKILHHTNIPAIYVTHDQEEAFAIADRVLILHNGQIVRAGNPSEVWEHPGSVFVAGFLGLGNIFEGEYIDKSKVDTRFGIVIVHCEHKHTKGDRVHLLARPWSSGNEPNAIVGGVTDVIFQQDQFKVTLDNGLYVYLQEAPRMGEDIEVRVEVECLA
jgi:ABC-type Fe3+/spermidine/putrescine transport system ATPase subunit